MQEVNFSKIISDLQALGYSYSDLARHLGAPKSYIARLKNGAIKDPSWKRGNALLALRASTLAGRGNTPVLPTGMGTEE